MPVAFYGRTEHGQDSTGRLRVSWVDARHVLGMPYDVPDRRASATSTVNTLRLWRARASQELDLADFNAGDYLRGGGGQGRLREHLEGPLPERPHGDGQGAAAPAAVLLRRLLDPRHRRAATSRSTRASTTSRTRSRSSSTTRTRRSRSPSSCACSSTSTGVEWDHAWELCRATFGYTNHTLMPEALEKWSVDLFGRVLPRHLEIVYEVNRAVPRRRCARRTQADEAALARMSIIEEGPVKQVRMANLAVVGSRSVNGVAALHTELLKRELFQDFHALWPEKFNNKTNGVTPRRWLLQANPAARERDHRGDRARSGSPTRRGCARSSRSRTTPGSGASSASVKRENKARLAEIVKAENGITLDLDSIFDVQVKRIHEYKRQLLAILRIAAEYLRMKEDRSYRPHPRSYLFGGKAAPGYAMAKCDHQARQLGRRRGEPRRRPAGPHHRRVPQELPGVARGADLPGRGRVGADLDRRQGGVRHRQHEVRAERRAHDRHARRRQRRDPRGGRARRTSSCSASPSSRCTR